MVLMVSHTTKVRTPITGYKPSVTRKRRSLRVNALRSQMSSRKQNENSRGYFYYHGVLDKRLQGDWEGIGGFVVNHLPLKDDNDDVNMQASEKQFHFFRAHSQIHTQINELDFDLYAHSTL